MYFIGNGHIKIASSFNDVYIIQKYCRLMIDVQVSAVPTNLLLLPLNVKCCVDLHLVATEKHNLIISNFILHSLFFL